MSVNNDVYQMLVGKWGNNGTLLPLKGASSLTAQTTPGTDDYNNNITACAYGADTAYHGENKLYFVAKNEKDLTFSPQFCIETKRIKAISLMPFYGGQDEIQYLNEFMPDVTEKEIELGKILQIFGIKVQAENKKLMKILGLGAYTKTVFSDKVCFDMSTDIFHEDGDSSKSMKHGSDLVEAYRLYKKYAALITLYNAINKNEDDYFRAYFAQTITPATGCNAATIEKDYDITHADANDTLAKQISYLACAEKDGTETFLCIESKPIAKKNFCSINMHYYKDRFTSLKVSLVEGFCCGAEMIVAQEAHSSNGEGYDVRYREYRAGGWNGKPGPYRTYAVTGLPKEEIVYHADVNGQYDLASVTYEISRIAGWLDHRSWVTVEFAVPVGQCGTLKTFFENLAEVAEVELNEEFCCADCNNVGE